MSTWILFFIVHSSVKELLELGEDSLPSNRKVLEIEKTLLRSELTR